MNDMKLTKEILDALGFAEYWCKGDYGRRHLDLNGPTNYWIADIDADEYGHPSYDIPPSPQHFTSSEFTDLLETVADLVEDIKRKCTPDEIMTFLTRVNKLA